MMKDEDIILEFANLLNKHYNPCKMDGNSCLVGSPNPCCFNTRFTPEEGSLNCPSLIENKCTNPNASCRIWLCETALKNLSKEGVAAFYSLQAVAIDYNLMHKPYLGELYFGADKPIC